MNNIQFKLNVMDTIIVEFEESLVNVHCCSLAFITLHFNGQRYEVAKDSLYYYMKLFHTLLIKSINNEFQLHQSITVDIGYLGNESFQNKPYLVYEKRTDEWVGEKHSLWSGNGFATWLYNNKVGDIILEITPFYPFHHYNKRGVKPFISYDEWIKDYKPYLIQEIPKNTAQQWLKQTKDILATIEKNTELERFNHENEA